MKSVSLIGLALAIGARAAAANPAPDGFLLVPSIGVSAAHFSQPPDDEGPQWLVGPTFGIFLGARLHGVTFGLAFDHTQALVDAEAGYETERVTHRIERITGRIGYAFRAGHVAVTPSLSFGLLDSDAPFYYEELVGVTGSAALAVDWALSPAVALGGNFSFDLGAAPVADRTVTSYGATLGAHLGIRL